MHFSFRTLFAAVLVASAAAGAFAAQLSPTTAAQIDRIAAQALIDSGAPSVSIAVVQRGQIVYQKAYGKARLDPATDARPEMRYSIGSVSKQFLAGSILLLVQDGKLSLDDRVSRYLPDLTRPAKSPSASFFRTPPAIRIIIRKTTYRRSCRSRSRPIAYSSSGPGSRWTSIRGRAGSTATPIS